MRQVCLFVLVSIFDLIFQQNLLNRNNVLQNLDVMYGLFNLGKSQDRYGNYPIVCNICTTPDVWVLFLGPSNDFMLTYRKVVSSRPIYYSIFERFWDATNWDVLLKKTEDKSVQLVRGSFLLMYFLQNSYFN